MAKVYEVHVGNVGLVYSGSSETEAREKFAHYKESSLSGRGRAGGESVWFGVDGEPIKDFVGANDQGDDEDDE
jgi:hypothetical protein